jgi:hypothetical protein
MKPTFAGGRLCGLRGLFPYTPHGKTVQRKFCIERVVNNPRNPRNLPLDEPPPGGTGPHPPRPRLPARVPAPRALPPLRPRRTRRHVRSMPPAGRLQAALVLQPNAFLRPLKLLHARVTRRVLPPPEVRPYRFPQRSEEAA